MKKRIFSVCMTLALLLGLCVPAEAAGPFLPVELDLVNGSIVITETGYTQGEGEEVPFAGGYRIVQSNPTPTTNTVTVSGGEHSIVVVGMVNIDVHTKSDVCAFAVASGAKADLQIEQDLSLKSGDNRAGLEVPAGAAINVSAVGETGSLTAIAGNNGAGIGGGNSQSSGDITLASGGCVAQGGSCGAGIGGGSKGSCGNLTILSGTVSVQGGSRGAGIGGGFSANGTVENGTISIQGGTVTAKGKDSGCGIGGGGGNYSGNSTVYSSSYYDAGGAGTGTGGSIEITNDAEVSAIGSEMILDNDYGHNGNMCYFYGAGIGGVSHGTGPKGSILISGTAHVTATGNGDAAGIGGGLFWFDSDGGSYYDHHDYGTGTGTDGQIKISGNAAVSANATGGAGIGGSRGGCGTGSNGQILITDSAQVTSSSTSGSGIGGGNATGSNGVITLEKNAVINATGGSAGIGGNSSSTGTLNLSAKEVNATAEAGGSALKGAGIINIAGGRNVLTGKYGILDGKTFFYGGETIIHAADTAFSNAPFETSGGGNAWVISDKPVKSDAFHSGVLFSENQGAIYGAEVNGLVTCTLPGNVEIPAGCTLTIAKGQKLVIPTNKTLTVNGTLAVNGLLVRQGKLVTGDTGTVQDLNHTHKLVNIVETPATCTETGIRNHWKCSICGCTFADSKGEVRLESVELPIDPSNHVGGTTLQGAVPATCTSSGRTGDLYCNSCRGLIKASVDIAPVGHSYNQDGICTECGAEEDPNSAAVVISGCQKAHEGEEITLEVSLRNNPGITAMGLDLWYDDTQLKLIKAEDTGLLHESAMDPSYTANPYGLHWCDYSAKENNTASGVIARLTFQVLEDCVEADTWVQLSYAANNILDCNGQPVAFDLTNGRVSTIPAIYGDVTGDKLVDYQDVFQLGRFQAGWEGYTILKKPADVDVSGVINGVDLAMLTRYVAKWPNINLGTAPAKPSLLFAINENQGTITLSKTSGRVGDTVQVTVDISNNPGIVLANLQVDYDTQKLKLVNVESKDVLTDFISPEIPELTPYHLLWNDSAKKDTDTRNGTMAVLTFEILPGCSSGDSVPVSVSYQDGDVIDYYLQPVRLMIASGSVEVLSSKCVELSASIDRQQSGDVTLDVIVQNKGKRTNGYLVCTAYNRDGRMLMIKNKYMELNIKDKIHVSVQLNCRNAAKYKVFFVGSDYEPLGYTRVI